MTFLAANIGPRSDPRAGSKKGYGSGKQTLRFKANGQAEVEDVVSWWQAEDVVSWWLRMW